MATNPPTDAHNSFGLKRKLVAILGIEGTVWALIVLLCLSQPSIAPEALMAGVATTSTVTAVIGAE